MRENAIELGDTFASVGALTQQKLKIAERVRFILLETWIRSLALKNVQRKVATEGISS